MSLLSHVVNIFYIIFNVCDAFFVWCSLLSYVGLCFIVIAWSSVLFLWFSCACLAVLCCSYYFHCCLLFSYVLNCFPMLSYDFHVSVFVLYAFVLICMAFLCCPMIVLLALWFSMTSLLLSLCSYVVICFSLNFSLLPMHVLLFSWVSYVILCVFIFRCVLCFFVFVFIVFLRCPMGAELFKLLSMLFLCCEWLSYGVLCCSYYCPCCLRFSYDFHGLPMLSNACLKICMVVCALHIFWLFCHVVLCRCSIIASVVCDFHICCIAYVVLRFTIILIVVNDFVRC